MYRVWVVERRVFSSLVSLSVIYWYPSYPGQPAGGDGAAEDLAASAAALAAYMLASSCALVMFLLYRILLLPNQLLTYYIKWNVLTVGIGIL